MEITNLDVCFALDSLEAFSGGVSRMLACRLLDLSGGQGETLCVLSILEESIWRLDYCPTSVDNNSLSLEIPAFD